MNQIHLQMESFIVFRWPIIWLWFCCVFSLFLLQMWSYQVNFNKWTKHSWLYYPLQVICGDDWKLIDKKKDDWKNFGKDNAQLPLTVTLCSPVPGCVKRSIWTDTSPTTPSSWLPVSIRMSCLIFFGKETKKFLNYIKMVDK